MNIRIKPRHSRTVVAIGLFGLAGIALSFPGNELLHDIGDRLVDGGQRLLALVGVPASTTATPTSSPSMPTVAHATFSAHAGNAVPMTTRDASGWVRTFTRSGSIDTSNTFFQPIGTNGRSCNSCHRQEAAWSITPGELRERFAQTAGTDPIFRRNDGSVSPLADVDDPYHYASAHELSLFRRPLPSTNLAFLTGIMWDGRETVTPFLPPMHAGQSTAALTAALIKQASDATIGHAEGLDPTPAQLADIVAFESGLTTAQIRDDEADFLNADDAIGGPRVLAVQRFHVGINDTLGGDPTGSLFDPGAMGVFEGWNSEEWRHDNSRRARARASIARGEALFNNRALTITGVGGLNDSLGVPSIPGTCSSCHDSPNVGNHSVALPLNIGLTDAARRTPDMPLYTLRNNSTGALLQTTDPGLALISGKWKDIGKFKGPILRGLAARPPYFHNGSAASLDDVVDFYNTRFAMHLSIQEKRDLVAFLRSL